MLTDRLNTQKTEWNVDGERRLHQQIPWERTSGVVLSAWVRGDALTLLLWGQHCRVGMRALRNGNGRSSHHPDCREEEVICSRFTADCGQTSSPREQRRAEEGSGCCNSVVRCRVLQPHRALCRGRFIKLRVSN